MEPNCWQRNDVPALGNAMTRPICLLHRCKIKYDFRYYPATSLPGNELVARTANPNVEQNLLPPSNQHVSKRARVRAAKEEKDDMVLL